MFNGFNKGFSLGFAGRVFNRGFSTKILSITKTTEVVEENTGDITGTPTGSDGLGGITPPDDGLSGPGPGTGGAGPAPP